MGILKWFYYGPNKKTPIKDTLKKYLIYFLNIYYGVY